jgi:hypothetical protein
MRQEPGLDWVQEVEDPPEDVHVLSEISAVPETNEQAILVIVTATLCFTS